MNVTGKQVRQNDALAAKEKRPVTSAGAIATQKMPSSNSHHWVPLQQPLLIVCSLAVRRFAVRFRDRDDDGEEE